MPGRDDMQYSGQHPTTAAAVVAVAAAAAAVVAYFQVCLALGCTGLASHWYTQGRDLLNKHPRKDHQAQGVEHSF